MAELTPKERLQPALLDRLTDLEPDQAQESREARVMTESQLRERVRRDLSWLLNTTHLAAIHDLTLFPEVARSVLNFGVVDLAGQTLSGVDRTRLEQGIREAIWNFEPRLLRDKVRVRVVPESRDAHRNQLVFHIEAELWAQPVPIALYLRTEVDLENGTVKVEERGMLENR